MKHTIILDFMGVIAEVDYLDLFASMPLKQKFSSLRILTALKKDPEIKRAFNSYQLGYIDSCQFQEVVAQKYPKSAYAVSLLLEAFYNNIKINQEVVDLIPKLRAQGTRVLIMSNTIPETEAAIMNSGLPEMVDGIILSTMLGMKKPSKEIYEYAIHKYALTPLITSMIDDKKKNLVAASSFGINPIRANSTNHTVELLKNHLIAMDLVDTF